VIKYFQTYISCQRTLLESTVKSRIRFILLHIQNYNSHISK
jgi:hypothetical protein